MKHLSLILLIVFLAGQLLGCDFDEPLSQFTNKHEALIQEFRYRGSWNNSHNKDFILSVEFIEDGITFHSSFIVHLIGRNDEWPKDMDVITMDKYGLRGVK